MPNFISALKITIIIKILHYQVISRDQDARKLFEIRAELPLKVRVLLKEVKMAKKKTNIAGKLPEKSPSNSV